MSHSNSLGLSSVTYKIKRLNKHIRTYQHLVSNTQNMLRNLVMHVWSAPHLGKIRSNFAHVGISGHPSFFFSAGPRVNVHSSAVASTSKGRDSRGLPWRRTLAGPYRPPHYWPRWTPRIWTPWLRRQRCSLDCSVQETGCQKCFKKAFSTIATPSWEQRQLQLSLIWMQLCAV